MLRPLFVVDSVDEETIVEGIMAVSQLVREGFKKRHGYTIEAAASQVGILPRTIISRKHRIDIDEMIGRGYVHVGKAVDDEKMDQDSRRILRHW